MKTILILALAILAGCDGPRPLTAAEVHQAETFCHAHHREAVAFAATYDGAQRIVAIQCDTQALVAKHGGWQ